MVGEIVHIELPSRDFARSAAFYAKLFGWRSDGLQSGGHLSFEPPGGVAGSWIREALAEAPGPVPFVAVADVDKTLAEAERQGGRVLVHRQILPNRGVFGLLADCDGNVIGVLSAKDFGTGGAGTPENSRERPKETTGGAKGVKGVRSDTGGADRVAGKVAAEGKPTVVAKSNVTKAAVAGTGTNKAAAKTSVKKPPPRGR